MGLAEGSKVAATGKIGLPEARGLGCLVGLEGSVGEAPGRYDKD